MQRRQTSPANFDLFDIAGPAPAVSTRVKNSREKPPELPDIAELYRMFDIYNGQYFDSKLPRVKITWSKRMLVAGAYYPGKREIRLSVKYHTVFPEEVYDTLKHEMIHIIHLRHDAAFKRVAKRIGASIRATEHPSLRKPPRYVYICPHCLTEYPRQKRLRMASCGRCSKNGFDARYKLLLKKRFRQAAKD